MIHRAPALRSKVGAPGRHCGGGSVSPAQKKGIPKPGGPRPHGENHSLVPEASTFPEARQQCPHPQGWGLAEEECQGCPSGAFSGVGKWARLSLASPR